jgi:cytochrome c-type biogenesis protein CcmF
MVLSVVVPVVAGVDHAMALAMFGATGLVLGTVAQEFWRGTGARQAMSGERAPLALVSLVRRNRRRYGGYVVHVGMALLFAGVAASSALEHTRDAQLTPGQSTRIGDYTVTYEKPLAGVAEEAGQLEAIRIGAVLSIQRDGDAPFRATTERRYFPSTDPKLGPIGRYFEGESTSEIALHAGLTRDFWAAYQPDQEVIQKYVQALDKQVANRPPEEQFTVLGRFIGLLNERPPVGTFRLIASPLVSWIWLGAIISVIGGILALWPAPDTARRKATARAHARVAQDLGRA